ncbi:MAG TPA: ligase-associated DNA damage response endonuclease PdeM [Chitinophagales bacterium]|nr:ligase-associated DNA damage response endonuclease PdeM [Chitinophagales bacterium]
MLQILSKEIKEVLLHFTNQRALFWEAEKILILSDLHVGKAAHFRKSGIAVSSDILLNDLKNLEQLIHHFQPEKILIVGDLFHAGYNSDLEVFKQWRLNFTQDFILIAGNHDRLKYQQYDQLGIIIVPTSVEIGPFTFVHHPSNIEENQFYISGHIHPGCILQGKNERIRLPCFAVSAQQIILPAFSKFTGLDTKSLSNDFANIVFSEDSIFEL